MDLQHPVALGGCVVCDKPNSAILLEEGLWVARFPDRGEQAGAVIDEVQQVVAARWEAVLRHQVAAQAGCDAVAAAFNDAGFELDPTKVLAAR